MTRASVTSTTEIGTILLFGAMASTKAAMGSVKRTKKRARPSGDPFSAPERRHANELLRTARSLLFEMAEDLPDKALTDRERADLRFNLREVEGFVDRATGGAHYARNRRWSLLYEFTKAARDEGRKLTESEIRGWPLLPASYAALTDDAIAARALLVKCVTARTRYEWLQLLVDAIAEVEAAEMGDHEWFPDAFEATIHAHRRQELRVLGVSDPRTKA